MSDPGPGPLLHFINGVLHTEPYSELFYGFFWTVILVFVSPWLGLVVLLRSAFLIFYYIVVGEKEVSTDGGKELAVFITGCDSEPAKNVVTELERRGYVVFASCMTEKGMRQYEGRKNVIGVHMDVTSDNDCFTAASKVSKWIESGNNRILHAVVNNAGIGSVGLVDWVDLDVFRKVMELNCFGVVRTTKAFLPLLKQQVYSGTYTGRIINVLSAASLLSGVGTSAYGASKHAAEAFTGCLRAELKTFGLKVIGVYPSWHDTPLLEKQTQPNHVHNEDEYGTVYVRKFGAIFEEKRHGAWDSELAVNATVSSITSLNPLPQVLVGSDTMYAATLLRMLPAWARSKVLTVIYPLPKASAMEQS